MALLNRASEDAMAAQDLCSQNCTLTATTEDNTLAPPLSQIPVITPSSDSIELALEYIKGQNGQLENIVTRESERSRGLEAKCDRLCADLQTLHVELSRTTANLHQAIGSSHFWAQHYQDLRNRHEGLSQQYENLRLDSERWQQTLREKEDTSEKCRADLQRALMKQAKEQDLVQTAIEALQQLQETGLA